MRTRLQAVHIDTGYEFPTLIIPAVPLNLVETRVQILIGQKARHLTARRIIDDQAHRSRLGQLEANCGARIEGVREVSSEHERFGCIKTLERVDMVDSAATVGDPRKVLGIWIPCVKLCKKQLYLIRHTGTGGRPVNSVGARHQTIDTRHCEVDEVRISHAIYEIDPRHAVSIVIPHPQFHLPRSRSTDHLLLEIGNGAFTFLSAEDNMGDGELDRRLDLAEIADVGSGFAAWTSLIPSV